MRLFPELFPHGAPNAIKSKGTCPWCSQCNFSREVEFRRNSIHSAAKSHYLHKFPVQNAINYWGVLSMVLETALIFKEFCPWCSSMLFPEKFGHRAPKCFYLQGNFVHGAQKAIISGDFVHGAFVHGAPRWLFSREVCPWYSSPSCSQRVLTILSCSSTGPAELKGWLSYDSCQATKTIAASTSKSVGGGGRGLGALGLQFPTFKLVNYFWIWVL